MSPEFSILHATLGRARKAMDTMLLWQEFALKPRCTEYIFSCNADDPTAGELVDYLRAHKNRFATPPLVMMNPRCHGSAMAWDLAAVHSKGSILIQAQDDVEPPMEWDFLISGLMHMWIREFNKPMVVAVSDGYRKDRLMCTAIINRLRYEQQGEFIHAGYRSVFSDDEFSYRAYRDAKEGKCQVLDARDLVFKHEHHYHNPAVPWDATYAHENSQAAYEMGRKLFYERNPEAATDGIRDWN